METQRAILFPDLWLDDLLSSKSARSGGVVRRKVRDVERIMGMPRFLCHLQQRGFQVVRNGDHLVIFCNQLPIRRVL